MQMLKTVGLLLVALCGVLSGTAMALGLKERVRALELSKTLLQAFAAELSYSLAPPDEIVARLSARETLAKAGYLARCGERCGGGTPFPQAWRDAVRAEPGALSREDVEVLASLSDTLGRCDLTEALGALNRAGEALELSLTEAREYARTHGKLYRTLGALAGVFFIILWI